MAGENFCHPFFSPSPPLPGRSTFFMSQLKLRLRAVVVFLGPNFSRLRNLFFSFLVLFLTCRGTDASFIRWRHGNPSSFCVPRESFLVVTALSPALSPWPPVVLLLSSLSFLYSTSPHLLILPVFPLRLPVLKTFFLSLSASSYIFLFFPFRPISTSYSYL